MYEPTYWKDEVVENPYRYKETQNSDGSIEHVPDPGEVLQEGTEQSATNFNHMEQGILEGHSVLELWLEHSAYYYGHHVR